MKLFDILAEARSHAKQNPKTSINQHITDALTKAGKDKARIAGVYNCFVSLTVVDKLGINPQSRYDTPLGIYSYPAEYVHKVAADDRELSHTLPFAGDNPHVNIFSVRGNVINIGTISDVDVTSLYEKIAAVYHKYAKGDWKTDVDVVERIINDAGSRAKIKSLPGGQLWYVTMLVAARLAELTLSKPPIMWNKLFREIGVDGVVDEGNGIIHTNEKNQAVFFSTAAITHVERVYNKYSPDAIATKQAKGRIEHRRATKYVGMSDQQLIDLLPQRGADFMEYIKNPSKELLLAVIADSGYNIKHIKNPSLEIQLAAVDKTPGALLYIKNPSEQVQLAAVTSSPDAIKYIYKPSETVQIAAIRIQPSSIRLIDNPTEKAKQLAGRLDDVEDPYSLPDI